MTVMSPRSLVMNLGHLIAKEWEYIKDILEPSKVTLIRITGSDPSICSIMFVKLVLLLVVIIVSCQLVAAGGGRDFYYKTWQTHPHHGHRYFQSFS